MSPQQGTRCGGEDIVPASHDRRLILGGYSFFGSFLMPGEKGQCNEVTKHIAVGGAVEEIAMADLRRTNACGKAAIR